MARPREDINGRFWSRVRKTTKCWEWTGSKFRGGYGQISMINKEGKKMNLKTHRLSFQIHFGPIPKGKLICHKCDNSSCVRPSHLFVGTWKSNVADMIKKGRKADTSGEKNGMSKITKKMVGEIRAKYARNKRKDRYTEKEFSSIRLAKEYGIGQPMISRIIRNEAWI